MDKKIEKVVFKEEEYSRPKVLFGTVTDDGDFLIVKCSNGNTITVNKKCIVFRKDGCY